MNMYDKLDSYSFKELLGYSIEAEKAANEYYNKFSEAAIGELMGERFKSLARDEEIHKDALLRIHKEEFGDEDYEVPVGDDLPPSETKFKFQGVMNMIDSLEKAVINENSAKRIYKYLAKRENKYASEFEYLALMEKGHAESLRSEKEMLEGKIVNQPDKRGASVKEFWKFHKDHHVSDIEKH
ncbi:MAG: ferritin family protein [Thermoplasmata archaeon]